MHLAHSEVSLNLASEWSSGVILGTKVMLVTIWLVNYLTLTESLILVWNVLGHQGDESETKRLEFFRIKVINASK